MATSVGVRNQLPPLHARREQQSNSSPSKRSVPPPSYLKPTNATREKWPSLQSRHAKLLAKPAEPEFENTLGNPGKFPNIIYGRLVAWANHRDRISQIQPRTDSWKNMSNETTYRRQKREAWYRERLRGLEEIARKNSYASRLLASARPNNAGLRMSSNEESMRRVVFNNKSAHTANAFTNERIQRENRAMGQRIQNTRSSFDKKTMEKDYQLYMKLRNDRVDFRKRQEQREIDDFMRSRSSSVMSNRSSDRGSVMSTRSATNTKRGTRKFPGMHERTVSEEFLAQTRLAGSRNRRPNQRTTPAPQDPSRRVLKRANSTDTVNSDRSRRSDQPFSTIPKIRASRTVRLPPPQQGSMLNSKPKVPPIKGRNVRAPVYGSSVDIGDNDTMVGSKGDTSSRMTTPRRPLPLQAPKSRPQAKPVPPATRPKRESSVDSTSSRVRPRQAVPSRETSKVSVQSSKAKSVQSNSSAKPAPSGLDGQLFSILLQTAPVPIAQESVRKTSAGSNSSSKASRQQRQVPQASYKKTETRSVQVRKAEVAKKPAPPAKEPKVSQKVVAEAPKESPLPEVIAVPSMAVLKAPTPVAKEDSFFAKDEGFDQIQIADNQHSPRSNQSSSGRSSETIKPDQEVPNPNVADPKSSSSVSSSPRELVPEYKDNTSSKSENDQDDQTITPRDLPEKDNSQNQEPEKNKEIGDEEKVNGSLDVPKLPSSTSQVETKQEQEDVDDGKHEQVARQPSESSQEINSTVSSTSTVATEQGDKSVVSGKYNEKVTDSERESTPTNKSSKTSSEDSSSSRSSKSTTKASSYDDDSFDSDDTVTDSKVSKSRRAKASGKSSNRDQTTSADEDDDETSTDSRTTSRDSKEGSETSRRKSTTYPPESKATESSEAVQLLSDNTLSSLTEGSSKVAQSEKPPDEGAATREGTLDPLPVSSKPRHISSSLYDDFVSDKSMVLNGQLSRRSLMGEYEDQEKDEPAKKPEGEPPKDSIDQDVVVPGESLSNQQVVSANEDGSVDKEKDQELTQSRENSNEKSEKHSAVQKADSGQTVGREVSMTSSISMPPLEKQESFALSPHEPTRSVRETSATTNSSVKTDSARPVSDVSKTVDEAQNDTARAAQELKMVPAAKTFAEEEEEEEEEGVKTPADTERGGSEVAPSVPMTPTVTAPSPANRLKSAEADDDSSDEESVKGFGKKRALTGLSGVTEVTELTTPTDNLALLTPTDQLQANNADSKDETNSEQSFSSERQAPVVRESTLQDEPEVGVVTYSRPIIHHIEPSSGDVSSTASATTSTETTPRQVADDSKLELANEPPGESANPVIAIEVSKRTSSGNSTNSSSSSVHSNQLRRSGLL